MNRSSRNPDAYDQIRDDAMEQRQKEAMIKALIDGQGIDRETLNENGGTQCEECGALMEYEPRFEHYDDGTRSYHAWAVCPECGNEWEF